MTRPGSRPSLRILTVNTHKGFAQFNRRFMLHELREAVRHVAADIVFLQEVQGTHNGHSAKVADWPQAPHYEFLADQIWPQFAYGQNAAYPHGHHGNAILSKHRIVRQSNHDVSIAGKESRGLLHCEIDVPGAGEPLHAICVHLGLRQWQRQRQLRLLCDVIAEQVPAQAALIVAGDFNDWNSRAHHVVRECQGLLEVFEHSHGRAARTFPARFPLFPLDRIYVRNFTAHAPLALPTSPWSTLSDHAPLAAEVRM